MGPHAQKQHLVALPGPVDAEVGHRCCWQDAAQRIEGLGPDGLAPHHVCIVRALWIPQTEVFAHDGQQAGVCIEQPVHVTDIARAQRRGEHIGVSVVAVSPVDPIVVGDVTRRLLEVAHQPAAFEDLGQDI